MSVKKYKFISPGIFLSEVDNSQLPAAVEPMGPIIIGRSRMGPAMRPIKVNSFSEFVLTFGNPVPGKGGGDIWRNGNLGGPTYGPYAAQAYFKPQVGPVTYMRLLGAQSPSATPAGKAGWTTTGDASRVIGDNGGAYGLFLCKSSSLSAPGLPGYLAAVFYVESGGVILTGSVADGSDNLISGGTCGLFDSISTVAPEYKIAIVNNTGAEVYKTAFNFNESSAKYIRNVFNTNPQLTNGTVIGGGFSQGQNLYWLGESYASFINLKSDSDKTPAPHLLGPDAWATLLPLESTDGIGKQEYKMPFAFAETGWFFSQDLSTVSGAYDATAMQELFQVVSRDGGRWVQDNLKISIEALRYSRDTSGLNPYGTFSVIVRSAPDNDNVVRIVEQFDLCDLNPSSQNYIARKIGTKYMEWDETQLRLREYGEFNNQSKYIRILMNDDVDMAVTDPRYLPFGVYGPTKYIDTVAQSGSLATVGRMIAGADTSLWPIGLDGGVTTGIATGSDAGGWGIQGAGFMLQFPDVEVRHTASQGAIANPTDAFFGLQTSLNLQTSDSLLYDPGYVDYLWPRPADTNASGTPQWVFSLDDVCPVTGTIGGTDAITDAIWASGSRADGLSITCGVAGIISASYKAVIDSGYDRFTAPLSLGFDGLDITELEPFRNTLLTANTNPKQNYAYYSVQRALNSISDPEFVETNLISYPGLVEPTLTTKLLNICEDRGDALGVIDIQHVYTPFTEDTQSFNQRIGSVSQAVSVLEQRQLNTSYGCTYYPWVQVRDTIAGNLLWVPPSVVSIGTIAGSQAKSELWFAPAGFNRGGLSDGAAGIPVLGVTQRLTSKDRDNLYEANINPIASFPSEGIVVFGQKTLQTTPSALDRINVRRLLVYLKKEVSRIATNILFDQNTKVTWERFLGQVNPFLSSVQSRLGLTEFKVILDDTTTTPDLIDRNILYAKIFLKPARAIEFIAIDFVITRTGASFED